MKKSYRPWKPELLGVDLGQGPSEARPSTASSRVWFGGLPSTMSPSPMELDGGESASISNRTKREALPAAQMPFFISAPKKESTVLEEAQAKKIATELFKDLEQRNASLKRTNEALQLDLGKAVARAEQAEEEYEQLFQGKKALERKLDFLMAEFHTEHNTLQETEHALAELKTAQKAWSELQISFEEQQAQSKALLEVQRKELAEQGEQLQERTVTLERTRLERDALRQLETDVQRLEKALDDARQQRNGLLHSSEEQSTQIESLKSELGLLVREKESLTRENRKYKRLLQRQSKILDMRKQAHGFLEAMNHNLHFDLRAAVSSEQDLTLSCEFLRERLSEMEHQFSHALRMLKVLSGEKEEVLHYHGQLETVVLQERRLRQMVDKRVQQLEAWIRELEHQNRVSEHLRTLSEERAETASVEAGRALLQLLKTNKGS